MEFITASIIFILFVAIVLTILRLIKRELDSGRCEADNRNSREKPARRKS